MINNIIIGRKISIDCVKNKKTNIKLGEPEYLGFDFFIKNDDAKKMKQFIISTLKKLNVPVLNISISKPYKISNEMIWSKERIFDVINNNTDMLQKENKKHKIMIKKKILKK